MKILLDENLPESLLAALQRLGHQVDSVNHLKLKGLDNGTLYRQVAKDYELCFTRDAGFAHNVRQMRDPSLVKILRVIVPQQRVELFVPAFLERVREIRLGAPLQRRRLALTRTKKLDSTAGHRFLCFVFTSSTTSLNVSPSARRHRTVVGEVLVERNRLGITRQFFYR